MYLLHLLYIHIIYTSNDYFQYNHFHTYNVSFLKFLYYYNFSGTHYAHALKCLETRRYLSLLTTRRKFLDCCHESINNETAMVAWSPLCLTRKARECNALENAFANALRPPHTGSRANRAMNVGDLRYARLE